MKSGATIQFTTRLNPICTHTRRNRKISCKDSYRTLQRIGYIMTKRPIAGKNPISNHGRHERGIPPTNRNRYTHQFPPVQRALHLGNEVAQDDANRHGQKNPYREETVEQAELLERGLRPRSIAGGTGRTCLLLLLLLLRIRRYRRRVRRTGSVCFCHFLLSHGEQITCEMVNRSFKEHFLHVPFSLYGK